MKTLNNDDNQLAPLATAPTRLEAAFALVELLVVVAIITILTAILSPAFAKVRENARVTSCVSYLDPLALGLMQHGQAPDEEAPRFALTSTFTLDGMPGPLSACGSSPDTLTRSAP